MSLFVLVTLSSTAYGPHDWFKLLVCFSKREMIILTHYDVADWFGPIMGALLASGYYKFVKHFNYEEENPGQDAFDEREKQREGERVES